MNNKLHQGKAVTPWFSQLSCLCISVLLTDYISFCCDPSYVIAVMYGGGSLG